MAVTTVGKPSPLDGLPVRLSILPAAAGARVCAL